MATYMTTGTCARAINYEVADGVVTKCEFVGGFPGNTQGVAKLVVGHKVEEIVTLLKGIQCRNCGAIVESESAPEKCPVCDHPKSYFQLEEDNF